MQASFVQTLATLVAVFILSPGAIAQYVRPPGKTLRELAEAHSFHVGANFPNLYEKWREAGKSGFYRFDPEAAIAKDHFTIMTAGWEVYPGHTWNAATTARLCRTGAGTKLTAQQGFGVGDQLLDPGIIVPRTGRQFRAADRVEPVVHQSRLAPAEALDLVGPGDPHHFTQAPAELLAVDG